MNLKAILAPFIAILSCTHASALSIDAREVDGHSVGIRSTDASCANPNNAIALLRAYSPSGTDHFYTTDAAEMENAVTNLGYNSEGTAALVFGSQLGSTIPLYLLYSSGAIDHFYTTSADERDNAINNLGYTSEGTAAFVYPSQICNSIPLYRLYSSGATDHFYTTSAAERDNAASNLGYSNEGIAAYVLQ